LAELRGESGESRATDWQGVISSPEVLRKVMREALAVDAMTENCERRSIYNVDYSRTQNPRCTE
jgi:hypothetical protein